MYPKYEDRVQILGVSQMLQTFMPFRTLETLQPLHVIQPFEPVQLVEPVESVEPFELVEVFTERGGGSPPAAGWELTSGPKSLRNPSRNPPVRGFP